MTEGSHFASLLPQVEAYASAMFQEDAPIIETQNMAGIYPLTPRVAVLRLVCECSALCAFVLPCSVRAMVPANPHQLHTL